MRFRVKDFIDSPILVYRRAKGITIKSEGQDCKPQSQASPNTGRAQRAQTCKGPQHSSKGQGISGSLDAPVNSQAPTHKGSVVSMKQKPCSNPPQSHLPSQKSDPGSVPSLFKTQFPLKEVQWPDLRPGR